MILTNKPSEYINLMALDPRKGFELTKPVTVSNEYRFTLNPTDMFEGTSDYPQGTRGYFMGEITDIYPQLHKLHMRPMYLVVMGLEHPCQLLLEEHDIKFVESELTPTDLVTYGLFMQAFPVEVYEGLMTKQYDMVSAFRMSHTLPV